MFQGIFIFIYTNRSVFFFFSFMKMTNFPENPLACQIFAAFEICFKAFYALILLFYSSQNRNFQSYKYLLTLKL